MSRKFTKKDWPKRPAVIEHGSWWASIVSVKRSSGVREDELAWACEILSSTWNAEWVATEAARTWYDETDQSGIAELIVRVEAHGGDQWDVHVEMRPAIAVKSHGVARVESSQAASGVGQGAAPPAAREGART